MSHVSWDDYFMGIAFMASLRSKDENTKVGACIVDKDNRILSTGFNGAPRKFNDNNVPKTNKGEWLKTKYPYVCHSELNALLNYRGSQSDFNGAKIYVTLFPCNECAKAIIQSGIREVVYDSDKYEKTPGVIASKKMLTSAGVKLRKYEHSNRDVRLDL